MSVFITFSGMCVLVLCKKIERELPVNKCSFMKVLYPGPDLTLSRFRNAGDIYREAAKPIFYINVLSVSPAN